MKERKHEEREVDEDKITNDDSMYPSNWLGA